MEHDDINELFSELKKESLVKYTAQNIKPKYIELEAGKYALDIAIQTISTSQLVYDEQHRTYLVYCKPLQPFVNDVIRYWEAGTVRPLKLGLVSATTNKVAIMHVSGVKVTKQVMNATTVVSIALELDKESNTNDIISTGIRMKMNVLADVYDLDDALTSKRTIAKQCDDAVARALSQRIKEIEDQKTAKAEDEVNYKAIEVAYKRLGAATGIEYDAIKAQIAYLEEQYKAACWRKV